VTTTTTTTAPLLGCRDLVVRAGGRVVLDVEMLDVEAGETLAVLGPNGAGKSTLLRALALLQQDRTGTVLLDGSPAGRRQLRPAVAAVLQRPVVLRGNVRRNVAGGLLLRGAVQQHRAGAVLLQQDRPGAGAQGRGPLDGAPGGRPPGRPGRPQPVRR
jgi:ABC-type iron transport system FetAB ATPase subunit